MEANILRKKTWRAIPLRCNVGRVSVGFAKTCSSYRITNLVILSDMMKALRLCQ